MWHREALNFQIAYAIWTSPWRSFLSAYSLSTLSGQSGAPSSVLSQSTVQSKSICGWELSMRMDSRGMQFDSRLQSRLSTFGASDSRGKKEKKASHLDLGSVLLASLLIPQFLVPCTMEDTCRIRSCSCCPLSTILDMVSCCVTLALFCPHHTCCFPTCPSWWSFSCQT